MSILFTACPGGDEPETPIPGNVSDGIYTVNGICFKMIPVEGGTFTMGATAEQEQVFDAYSYLLNLAKPTHSVTLSNFSIGETEVTQELWEAVMGSNPSDYKGNKKSVHSVSWDDCQEFIRKLNSLTGRNFRLPTEAEWEYAARGGKKSKGYTYAGSNMIDNVAWYRVNSYDKGSSSPFYGPQNVGSLDPNELGLYDMSGNVEEWCYDWHDDYSSSAQTNPTGPSTGAHRVIRGGSWGALGWAECCLVSCRTFATPYSRNYYLGLRLAL